MKLKYLIKGFIKSIPGIEKIYNFHKETGGTNNARYCYSVWMRHLVSAHENGLNTIPKRIAELGPGDSLGIGLSALLSGAEDYLALDIIKFSNEERNLKIFDELVFLFKNKTSVPLDSEFPNMHPALNSYEFPSHILTDEILVKALDENRLAKIRNSIIGIEHPEKAPADTMIQYRVPWNDAKVMEVESIDMIISQAVLQHIDKLEETYACMNKWLKKNGIMSHSIDLKSMGSSDTWDGHWGYSDAEWKIVRGRKNYLINREPYSKHVELLKRNNLTILCDKKSISTSSFLNGKKLAEKFKKITHTDLTVSGTFIQAIKGASLSVSIFWAKFLHTMSQMPEIDAVLVV